MLYRIFALNFNLNVFLMKKYLILCFAVALAFVSHAQQWVSFGSTSEPSIPEVSILTSTAQSVSFEVTIPGIYALDTIVNGTAFTRLFLPKGGAVNPSGSPPEVSVNRNDNQQVSFTVELSGMYVESRNEEGSVYKRLSMPECQTMGEVGAPEIPVVTKMVAIPEYSDFNIVVTMSGVQTFSNYLVFF